eukprot:2309659-Prymnesium_polylepis.2
MYERATSAGFVAVMLEGSGGIDEASSRLLRRFRKEPSQHKLRIVICTGDKMPPGSALRNYFDEFYKTGLSATCGH